MLQKCCHISAVAIVIQNTSFEKNNEDTGPQKADENTISDIKSLDYLEVNNLNTSRIVASPEQEDTDERNNELLNNTLDISPIRVGKLVDTVMLSLG